MQVDTKLESFFSAFGIEEGIWYRDLLLFSA